MQGALKRWEMSTKCWSINPTRRDNLENLRLDGNMILKWALEKEFGNMLPELLYLKIGTSVCTVVSIEFHERRRSWAAERLLVCQGLCLWKWIVNWLVSRNGWMGFWFIWAQSIRYFILSQLLSPLIVEPRGGRRFVVILLLLRCRVLGVTL
jgi:hypothetical protein